MSAEVLAAVTRVWAEEEEEEEEGTEEGTEGGAGG